MCKESRQEAEASDSGGILRHHRISHGWVRKSSPPTIVSVKECERQQERLLEVYQQQNQYQRKHGPANGWGGHMVTKDTGKVEEPDVLFGLVLIDAT